MGAVFSSLCSRDGRQAALTAQRIQGALFLAMGGACVVFPAPVLALSLGSELSGARVVRFVFQCFGAQACLAGALLCASTLDRAGHLMWAAAISPVVVFDALCISKGFLSPLGAAGDFVGNAVLAQVVS